MISVGLRRVRASYVCVCVRVFMYVCIPALEEEEEKANDLRTPQVTLLRGVAHTVHLLAVKFAYDVEHLLPPGWPGGESVILLLVSLSKLSDFGAKLNSCLASPDKDDLARWVDDFQHQVTETMDLLRAVPHQLRHLVNQVEFTDGGGGVAIKQMCVQLMMVLWLKLTGGRSISRFHNAPRNSKSMFAEQSVGAMNQYLSNDKPLDNFGTSSLSLSLSLSLASTLSRSLSLSLCLFQSDPNTSTHPLRRGTSRLCQP